MDPLDLLESGMVGRRTFLKGSGLVGGALFSASLFGKAVKQVYGEPIVIPKEVRTVEVRQSPHCGRAWAWACGWLGAGDGVRNARGEERNAALEGSFGVSSFALS